MASSQADSRQPGDVIESISFSHPSQPSSSRSSLQLPGPPPYAAPGGPSSDGIGLGMSKVYPGWQSIDPRSSSTQSLVPSLRDEERRRTLLIVYIHGFMGNDSSFRSFPAHVHAYLKETLRETHVVHSKIYPRYKTYKAIDVARDNFSRWLEPHEGPSTDVVLIGHSMGGLLAADAVLIPGTNGRQFKHRILGTISLDSPFLGLHPGIIVSGIASLFRPAPNPPKEDNVSDYTMSQTSFGPLSPDPSLYSELSPLSDATSPTLPTSPGSMSSTFSGPPDPTFNPPFFNDVQFRDRGWVKNIAHFTKKHKDENIFNAATSHIMNHLEFGSCLADYPGLNVRYKRLRQLEDVDVWETDANWGRATRVRFVNYFTISTGRVESKKGKEKEKDASPARTPERSPHLRPETALTKSSTTPGSGRNSTEGGGSKASTPRISIEDYSDGGRSEVLEFIDPVPEDDDEEFHSANEDAEAAAPDGVKPAEDEAPGMPLDLSLPPIPDVGAPPEPPNLAQYSDPTVRKQVEKETKQAQKAHDQAVKNRDKVIAERAKLLKKYQQKQAKEAAKEAEKAKKDALKKEKEEAKRRQKEEAEFKKEVETSLKDQARKEKEEQVKKDKEGQEKKKKERKFCMLPRKVGGERDGTWVQIYMEGVDEVGAHCGLFFPGPHYERLVGDVGSRIVGWVQEDASRRVVMELEEGVECVDLD